MSRILMVVAAVGITLLAFSNPSLQDFDAYVQARSAAAIEAEVGETSVGRAMARLGASLAGGLATAATDRHNYGLFSTYAVGEEGDGWTFLGIGGRFFQLSGPDRDAG